MAACVASVHRQPPPIIADAAAAAAHPAPELMIDALMHRRSLYRWRQGATPDVPSYASLAAGMLRSVRFLHSRGIVHR